jgi:catechol 2,3-dioxygenase-like lactoylglutathione lyase family enzyme
VISGSHVVVYTRDAVADRAFFRDVLRMPAVDAGGGWLIFALPPGEVAFHPADKNDTHQLYLMCDDLSATIKELEGQGIGCDEPSEEGWGITTHIHLPGGGHLGLYQPKHPTAFSSKGEI